MPKFTIITPVWYDKEDKDNIRQPRYEMFLRCANSVLNQTFEDFEWVIVDDFCNPSVKELLKDRDKRIKVIKPEQKGGRITSQNIGMENASGEWFCFLDADDEYSSVYLQCIDDAIRLYPDYKVFNMNHLVFHYDYKTEVRKFINMEEVGDRPFGSGTIGQGAFVLNKDVFKEVGKLPELGLWQLADWAWEHFPEIKPFFLNRENNGYNSLGNPWGNDFLYFYMITRKFKSKYLDTALYYVHSSFGHRFKEDKNYFIGVDPKPNINPKNK